jgi:tetratricopeptide (TPR) repeat protein
LGGFLFCGMKKILVFAFLLFTIHHSLLAQKELIKTCTDLLVARNYDAADHYLDSVLKKEPKNVDALMMKGNVVLNHDADTTSPAKFITADDESIFSYKLNAKPKIISTITVVKVEKFWRKCLQLDTTRADIRKGLCQIYAMSLMKKPLKEEMVRLKKAEKDDGEQPFRMAEYPRKFAERNKFDDAIELYQYIAKLYPDVAGIRCDIASEFFYKGRIKESLAWLDSCYNFKTVDETSFLNGAFIYSELGYFDDAQNVLNTYSRLYGRKMDQFYYGLRQFADTSDKYFETLNAFCQAIDSNAYSTEVATARKLIAYRDSFSLSDFNTMVNDKEIPEYYKVLIFSRGLKQFPERCEPSAIYGIYQASIKNYSSAIQFLDEAETCPLQPAMREFALLAYGYSLLDIDRSKALHAFLLLYNSRNNFYQQAAKYFSVKILKEEKRSEEAKKLSAELISDAEKTKYQELVQEIK